MPVTPFRTSGCATEATICPVSSQPKVSPRRSTAPRAVSTAPAIKAARNQRSNKSPQGIASTTYSSGNTCASQPIALSETP
jgi:hypothetical protein